MSFAARGVAWGLPLDAPSAASWGRGGPSSGSPCSGCGEGAAGAVGRAGADLGSPLPAACWCWTSWTSWRARGRTCSTPSSSGPGCPAPGSSSWVSARQRGTAALETLSLFWGGLMEGLPLHPTPSFPPPPHWGHSLVLLPSPPHPALPAGLANALDLTDRSLARLGARPAGSPRLLHFPPYTREQLTAILQERLGQVGTRGDTHTHTHAVGLCPCSTDGVRCLGRWLVTPSWTPPRSSSVPARSLRSPVMLARPWISAGQRPPQNGGAGGSAAPASPAWLCCTGGVCAGGARAGAGAVPGAQGRLSPGALWRWWSWRCGARPCSSRCLGVSSCCAGAKPLRGGTRAPLGEHMGTSRLASGGVRGPFLGRLLCAASRPPPPRSPAAPSVCLSCR